MPKIIVSITVGYVGDPDVFTQEFTHDDEDWNELSDDDKKDLIESYEGKALGNITIVKTEVTDESKTDQSSAQTC